jgi:3',5'-cyclic AMP phosphodiesterase CpdA
MALKFIHLTDPHLLAAGRALHGTDPTWRLCRAVASINAEHGDAAFVVITGDLADRGEPAAYAALAECLAPLRMPVHLAVGNHDDRAALCTALAGTPMTTEGFVQHAFDAGGMRHIVLDSLEPGVGWGVFCDKRAAWLSNELAHSTPRPVMLYIHHPPCAVGMAAMDRISLRDTQPLRQALMPHRTRIRHLFFGHLHRPLAGSWLGIPMSTVRGTNHQVALQLGNAPKTLGSHEPPQYAVVLAEDESTVVHLHDFEDASARFAL